MGTENWKSLMKENKANLDEWRDVFCLWTGRFNIVNKDINSPQNDKWV